MTVSKEVIQYAIHKLSAKIELMKTDILNDYPARKDTHRHMNPSHPTWSAYQELKRQASLHLTALSIFKHFGGKIPAKSDLRKAIRACCFLQHAPKGDKSKRNAFIFEAYSLLQSGFPEIDRAAAMKHAEHRALEAAKAKEAKNAVSC